MGWNGVRQLVLPAALAVTSFGVVLACGGDDEPKKKHTTVEGGTGTIPLCDDVPQGNTCQKCKMPDGSFFCAGGQMCYLDPDGETCQSAAS